MMRQQQHQREFPNMSWFKQRVTVNTADMVIAANKELGPMATLRMKPATPESILDKAVEKLETEREYHAFEISALEVIIDDAQKRLTYHRTAFDGIDKALGVIAPSLSLNPSELELDLEDAIQKIEARVGTGDGKRPAKAQVARSDKGE